MLRPSDSVSAALLLSGLVACATTSFEGGVFRDAQTAYRVGTLNGTWHRFDLPGGDLAFRNEAGGAILANAICTGLADLSLDVLTTQELMQLRDPNEQAQELVTLDGRSALETRETATLDGVPVRIELFVLKKDGCTYDFSLVASKQEFPKREAEFRGFVAGFQQLPRIN
jgi:hypothetical protein